MKSKGLAGIAAKGRNGDTHLAHLQDGETIVPPVISDETRQRLYEEMLAAGIDPSEYMVGGEMSINPETGLPEFGFGKSIGKAFKKVTKAVKKVVSSPIGQIGLSFALPGIGTALGAGLGISSLAGGALAGAGFGALSGNGLKGIASGALGGASQGLGGYLGKGISSATGLSGLASNSLGSALVGGTASKLGGGDALMGAAGGGLSSLYTSGAFNNLGKSFKEGGLSGALAEFGNNVSGTGDVLQATSGASNGVGGGGSSSYGDLNLGSGSDFYGQGSNALASNTLSTASPLAIPEASNSNIGTDMIGKKGLNSLLSAGIDTYSNNKAADQMLKYQKQGLAALTPYLNQKFEPGDLTQDPGYQFQLQQGTKALDSANAARGNYYSGDALRSAGQFATGLADQTYGDAYQRFLAGRQQNINGVLSQYGILGDMGNTKAAATIGNANSITDSLASYLDPQENSLEALLARLRG